MNSTSCWFCNKVFSYDGEKYRDVKCVHCGVENSIMNPEQPDWLPKEGEEEMGKLADRAKEKSPFVRLEIGEETPVLVYKSWKETQDHFGNDTFRYLFDLTTESGIVSKQLDNRSLSFAEAMDKIAFGEKVIIKREPKLDEGGDPVENKSIWTVRKVE